ncbi:MAG: hypothetical protein K0V04_33315 [Deltaproteobacteria bacterium]|nr:hypothetical protein [Deltaproteobacteria bacterium]
MSASHLRFPVFVAATLFAPTAWAATLHVDGNSVDPVQDGTAAHPYHGLGAALSAAAPGDTLAVGPGIYAEALVIDKAVTIEGAPRLRTVIEAPDSWHLDATGVQLRSLMFQGLGTGTGLEATRPFSLEDSQIQDFDIGVRTYEVSGNTSIRHNRIVGNTYGVVLTNSGWSTYVLVENNLIQGTHGGLGLYAYDSRFRAYHNAITAQWLGIYDILPSSRNLPISYARNNLVVADQYGVYGHNIDPSELKVWANSIDAPNPVLGIDAADQLWTTASACGIDPTQPWDHGVSPAGTCVDGGLFAGDPDGSAADIGLYGGPQGGPWWEDFGCRGPHVSCPAEQLASWLSPRPLVRNAMAFYDGGWVGYDGWSDDLRAEFDERFTDAWYGIEEPLVYPPPNLLAPGPLDFGTGVHDMPDAQALYLSNVAHSMLTELQGRVPWSLDDFDSGELALLLDARTVYHDAPWCDQGLCIPENLGLQVRHNSGFPAPGDAGWDFVDGEVGIGVDRLGTIGNALEWSRTNMRHFAGSLAHAQIYEYYWDYAGPVPALAVMDGTDPVGVHPEGAAPYDPPHSHYTAGCGGTNMWLQGALRSANIPVEFVAPHHSTPHFPSEGMWLSHGDDPYNAMAKAGYPAQELLIDDATYQAWFVDDPGGGWGNVGRRVRQLAAIHLPATLQQYRCNDLDAGDSKASGSVFGYLSGAYTLAQLDGLGFWVAIDGEIDAAGLCSVPLPLGSG